MVSVEEFEVMAGEIADNIPEQFYEGLNGGVLLREEERLHQLSTDKSPVYIMGLYIRDVLGCRIEIYYGSFAKTCRHFSKEGVYRKLKETIQHEFQHHVETMCGNRDLVIKDEENLDRVRKRRGVERDEN